MFARKQQQQAVQSVVLALATTTCAWCNAKAGVPQGNGSHGMCDECEAEEMAKYQAAKAEKQARKGRS